VGELILDDEYVLQLSVPILREDVKAGVGLDELCGHAYAIPGCAHAALEHMSDVESARDLSDICVLPLERERRRARRYLEARQLRQGVDDLFRDAVGEKLPCRVAAHVDEGEHGNGSLGGSVGLYVLGGGDDDPVVGHREHSDHVGDILHPVLPEAYK
jgi:hypothetical protein